MSVGVQLGLGLALATAFVSVIGFLLKHRGAVEAAEVDWRRPVRTSLGLFRARDYTIGIIVATAAWGPHVTPLSLAPISLVQAVIAGGPVMLTVIADRLFGHDVSRRECIGVALTTAGLAVLAATMSGVGNDAHADHSTGALATYLGLLTVAGLAAAAYGWGPSARRAPIVAASAGVL